MQLAERDEIRLARRGPPPRQPDGAARRRLGEAQQLHALVAHLDIDGDARQQRDAVAVRHHLHHRREARRAEAGTSPRALEQ